MTTIEKIKMLTGAQAVMVDQHTKAFQGFHEITADEAWQLLDCDLVTKDGRLVFEGCDVDYIFTDASLADLANA